MVKHAFQHVRHWVFDLDNTLYPPAVRLFDQIEAKMIDFVTRATGVDPATADQMRRDYYKRYGTTLAGLMHEHDIDAEAFLVDVHDISFEALQPDPHLASLIAQLPGRKIVYTNGSAPYAAQVLKARGLDGAFEAIYGIENAGFRPKPKRDAFERIFAQANLPPDRAAMFEDEARNLSAPHDMGMRTVHVAPTAAPAPHIHHHTDDLAAFLEQLV